MDVGIIGARGFVGARLLAYLQARGVAVTGYTRETLDLGDPSSFARLGEHDVVVNCAAKVSGTAAEMFAVNVEALHSLCAELNRRSRKPYLLQVSCGAVYGYADHAADVVDIRLAQAIHHAVADGIDFDLKLVNLRTAQVGRVGGRGVLCIAHGGIL